jgi:hypothetical protein
MFQQSQQSGENELEEDSETSLTAHGLMSAIRRILESISGMCHELYPELECILQEPILKTIEDLNQQSTEDGLHCLAELTFNQ